MTRTTAHVAVVGGGLGGIAAALAAADEGASVVLSTAEAVLGGQVTSQATSPLDEHPLIETTGAPGTYQEFRRRVRQRYGGLANPGGGWVSRLCFTPSIAQEVLTEMLAEHVDAGRVQILLEATPVAAQTTLSGDGTQRITALEFARAGGLVTEVAAAVVIDATEVGSVLDLSGADTVIGSEGQDAFGEPHALATADPRAEQSITWVAGLRLAPTPGTPVPATPGYADQVARGTFGLDIPGWDGRAHQYRMFSAGPTGNLPFWTYRRVHDATALGGTDAAVLNWASNDYAMSGLVDDPVRARRESRELTLGFVRWLQTEAPRDDGGIGYPELELAPEVTGTSDGLAREPYVRESRRLASTRPVTELDLAPGAQARSTAFADSIGTAWYHADLHPRVGHPAPVYAATAPFQVPARALVPEPGRGPVNLLAGAKNLAATQVAAAAYRVHPGEWSVGEGAGVIAAHSARAGVDPGALLGWRAGIRAVQDTLLARGTPLAWAEDLPADHPAFRAGQRAILAGALRGTRLGTLAVRPGEPASDEERIALAQVWDLDGLPAGRSWADVVLAADAARAETAPAAGEYR